MKTINNRFHGWVAKALASLTIVWIVCIGALGAFRENYGLWIGILTISIISFAVVQAIYFHVNSINSAGCDKCSEFVKKQLKFYSELWSCGTFLTLIISYPFALAIFNKYVLGYSTPFIEWVEQPEVKSFMVFSGTGLSLFLSGKALALKIAIAKFELDKSSNCGSQHYE